MVEYEAGISRRFVPPLRKLLAPAAVLALSSGLLMVWASPGTAADPTDPAAEAKDEPEPSVAPGDDTSGGATEPDKPDAAPVIELTVSNPPPCATTADLVVTADNTGKGDATDLTVTIAATGGPDLLLASTDVSLGPATTFAWHIGTLVGGAAVSLPITSSETVGSFTVTASTPGSSAARSVFDLPVRAPGAFTVDVQAGGDAILGEPVPAVTVTATNLGCGSTPVAISVSPTPGLTLESADPAFDSGTWTAPAGPGGSATLTLQPVATAAAEYTVVAAGPLNTDEATITIVDSPGPVIELELERIPPDRVCATEQQVRLTARNPGPDTVDGVVVDLRASTADLSRSHWDTGPIAAGAQNSTLITATGRSGSVVATIEGTERARTDLTLPVPPDGRFTLDVRGPSRVEAGPQTTEFELVARNVPCDAPRVRISVDDTDLVVTPPRVRLPAGDRRDVRSFTVSGDPQNDYEITAGAKGTPDAVFVVTVVDRPTTPPRITLSLDAGAIAPCSTRHAVTLTATNTGGTATSPTIGITTTPQAGPTVTAPGGAVDGLGNWRPGSLAPGQAATLRFTVASAARQAMTVRASGPHGAVALILDFDRQHADVAVQLRITTEGLVGDEVATLRIDVVNSGPLDTPVTVHLGHPPFTAVAPVTFASSDPGFDRDASAWSLGSLAAGARVELNATATATEELMDATVLVTALPTVVDCSLGDNTAAAQLSGTTTTNSVTDPTISVALPQQLDRGVTGTASIVVSNPSARTARDASVELDFDGLQADDGAASVSIGDVGPGQSETIQIGVTSTRDGESRLVATLVVPDEPEMNRADNQASATTIITPVVDLAVSLSPQRPPLLGSGADSTVELEITVINSGPSQGGGSVTLEVPRGFDVSADHPAFDEDAARWQFTDIATDPVPLEVQVTGPFTDNSVTLTARANSDLKESTLVNNAANANVFSPSILAFLADGEAIDQYRSGMAALGCELADDDRVPGSGYRLIVCNRSERPVSGVEASFELDRISADDVIQPPEGCIVEVDEAEAIVKVHCDDIDVPSSASVPLALRLPSSENTVVDGTVTLANSTIRADSEFLLAETGRAGRLSGVADAESSDWWKVALLLGAGGLGLLWLLLPSRRDRVIGLPPSGAGDG